MSRQIIPVRVHYLNLRPSEALSEVIEEGRATLVPYRKHVARCDVHVGCWVQHHDQGRNYRVTLELEPRAGFLPLSVECETSGDPEYAELLALVRDVFQRAVRRLAARVEHAPEMTASLSPEARRLHPLRGLAPEEMQLGAGDE